MGKPSDVHGEKFPHFPAPYGAACMHTHGLGLPAPNSRSAQLGRYDGNSASRRNESGGRGGLGVPAMRAGRGRHGACSCQEAQAWSAAGLFDRERDHRCDGRWLPASVHMQVHPVLLGRCGRRGGLRQTPCHGVCERRPQASDHGAVGGWGADVEQCGRQPGDDGRAALGGVRARAAGGAWRGPARSHSERF